MTKITAALLTELYEQLPFAVLGLTADGVIQFANAAAGKLLQSEVTKLVSKPFHTLVQDQDASGHKYDWQSSPIGNATRRGQYYENDQEFFANSKIDFPAHYWCLPTNDADTPVLLVIEDITSKRIAGNYLRHVAHQDTLTGLGGRLMFRSVLVKAIANAQRMKTEMAVLYLDLNGFKEINDTHGHGAGDQLLRQTAQRLQSVLRGSDVACRMGGDEFVILAANTSKNGVKRVAERILATVAEPVELEDGTMVRVSTSIGIAVFPEHGQIAEDLIEHADAAMYVAKAKKTGAYCYYRADLTD